MSKKCELCDKKSDMDFNAVVPISKNGKYIGSTIVKGNICLKCFSNYSDDIAVVMALFEKRKEKEKLNEQKRDKNGG